ncbi:MAG TPA: inositol monophosphatase family protein [Frankiaceae bacterium]|nr:inositol monophosphatase family protein [Frankiaceae bacterium]
MPNRSSDLQLALELADVADRITLARYAAVDLVVETKPDSTPVSDADTAVESALRSRLAQTHSGDAILGEEEGFSGAPDTERRWVIDPVDSTKNFIRTVPVWATLIALEVRDRVEVGVVSAPALGIRWWAARGQGAWRSDGTAAEPRRLQVSRVAALADASLSYSSLSGWEEQARLTGFLDLTRAVWRTRAYGDFWSHCLVAEGAVDVSTEPEVSHWDLAPLQVIVEEAGGRFTDLSGAPGPDGGSVVVSNGLLHDEALRLLTATTATATPVGA